VKIVPAEPEEQEFDPYEAWGTEKILTHFGVPPGEFKGETVAEAVAFLREIYAEHGGRNINFRIVGQGGYPLTFGYGNTSAQGLMEMVAGMGGYDLEIGEGEVVFRRKQSSGPSLQTMRLEGGKFVEILSHMGAEKNEDPFGQPAAQSLAARSLTALPNFFSEYGIEMTERVTTGFDQVTGDLVITNTGDQNDRILAAYRFMLDERTLGQVRIDGMSVGMSEGGTLETQSFNNADLHAALQELSQMSGASQTSVPSIVTVRGQRANIQVIREVIYPTSIGSAGTPTAYDFANVGISMEVEPVLLLGLDRIELEGHVELVTIGDHTLHDVLRESPIPAVHQWREEDIRTMRTEFGGIIGDGNTATFVGAEEGTDALQQFITVTRIRPDGQILLQE